MIYLKLFCRGEIMEKILVVDDSPGNIRIVAAMLQPNYNILAANNGVRAIKIAEDTQPDLILMDVMMPDMDGFTVCETLKKKSKYKRYPYNIYYCQNRTG